MPELKPEIIVDEWVGCYSGGWKGVIVDAAFAHPAKAAFNLAKRIYEHAIEEKWIKAGDICVDPFGGIGGCIFHGLMNGMIVVTNELESKFVSLSKENRELWRTKFTGLPGFDADNWTILQGDSRKLASVIREAGLSVSSPPYADGAQHTGGRDLKPEHIQGGELRYVYGASEGQLGAMREGDLTCAISSPPYIESLKPETEEQTARKQQRIAESKSIYDGRKLEEPSAGKAGNLGATPPGDLCVSSPPFPQNYSSGGGINKEGYRNDKLRPGSDEKPFDLVGKRTYQGRGGDRAEGNLETLETGSVELAITSPPFGGSTQAEHNPENMTAGRGARGGDSAKRVKQDYAPLDTEGNLQNMPTSDFEIAISSPPYNPPMSQDHNGSRGGKRGTEPSETGAFVKYGNSEGQIEGLSMDGFADACVSSPPFENVEGTIGSRKHKDPTAVAAKREADFRSGKSIKGNFASKEAILAQMERENDRTYGETEGQLGIEKGDTFWSASRTILEQLFQVLAPRSHAIFITKRFVRDKQIVEFTDQWIMLAEAVGFQLLHQHKAMLVEEHGAQHTLSGEVEEKRTERKSFFRRLAEKKGSPRIDWEDVTCFLRP